MPARSRSVPRGRPSSRPFTAIEETMPPSLICPDAFLSPLEIDAAVTRALIEDLGRAGDITSTATVPEDATARASVVARKAGTIAGLPLVEAALRKLEPHIAIEAKVRDGATGQSG